MSAARPSLTTAQAPPSPSSPLHDARIAAIDPRNAEALGRNFPDLGAAAERATGSTGMGNVSLMGRRGPRSSMVVPIESCLAAFPGML